VYDLERKVTELERQIQSLKSDLDAHREVISTKNLIITQNSEAIDRLHGEIKRLLNQ